MGFFVWLPMIVGLWKDSNEKKGSVLGILVQRARILQRALK